jgi:ribosomal protein L35AE/L33A
MEAGSCYLGQRVIHETDNNGPIWRGEITEVQNNGLVFVRWDGEARQTLNDPAILQPEQ